MIHKMFKHNERIQIYHTIFNIHLYIKIESKNLVKLNLEKDYINLKLLNEFVKFSIIKSYGN